MFFGMKGGETVVAMKKLALKIKQMVFDIEQMREGIISKFPAEFAKKGGDGREVVLQEKTIRSRDPAMQPTVETQVKSPDQVAQETAGALDMVPNQQVFETVKPDPACFTVGTPVHTDHGLSHIDDIVPGTMVLSRSEETGEIGYRRVVQIFQHDHREVLPLIYQHENGAYDSVNTTPEHPFWVVGKGWMPAGKLQVGMELEICDPEGGTFYGDRMGGLQGVLAQRLRGIRSKARVYRVGPIDDRKHQVYNLEVEGFHTYFVGYMGAWVHNKTVKPDPACFVFDTEVHTSLGLVAIGQIEPGMMVLSRSEATGEIGYRRVVNRFEHSLRSVFDLEYMNENGEAEFVTTTPEHPFWVIGKGWVPAGELQIGQELEICDPDGGEEPDKRPGGRQGVLAQELRGIRSKAKVHRLDPPLDRKYQVFNLEVEDFHTYFVGRMGVWVHNTNCAGDVAIEAGIKNAEYKANCFAEDTMVRAKQGLIEIQWITPGTEVLSRCEITGEMGYRKVLKHFTHENTPTYEVAVHGEDKLGEWIETTTEHPFWVKGKGWTEVRHLEFGQVVELSSGKTATIGSVIKTGRLVTVYNIEVEGFHTYFVGRMGVWVHNTNCAGDVAIEVGIKNAEYKANCFAEDTMVRAKQGLIEIQWITPGTEVLSRCEITGEMGYRKVLKHFTHENVPIYEVAVIDEDNYCEQILTTAEHPFWVRDIGWTEVRHLVKGHVVELSTGKSAVIHFAGKDDRLATVYNIKVEGFHTYFVGLSGVWVHNKDFTTLPTKDSKATYAYHKLNPAPALWTTNPEKLASTLGEQRLGSALEQAGINDVGVMLDLTDGLVKVASGEGTRNASAPEVGESFKTRVFNFEVEEFHTYYVGELGVWVHNTDCTGGEAITDGFKKPAYEAACFSGDTYVHTKRGPIAIEFLSPGAEVLSRCEKTGEMGYRKVVNCHIHENIRTYSVTYVSEDGTATLPITTTAEHPFWVKGRSWTAVRDLQPGDIIETCDGAKYSPKSRWSYRPADDTEIYPCATVIIKSVWETDYHATVYNLTIEEFHTYFVGFDGLWVHNL